MIPSFLLLYIKTWYHLLCAYQAPEAKKKGLFWASHCNHGLSYQGPAERQHRTGGRCFAPGSRVTFPLAGVDGAIHGVARGLVNWLTDTHPEDNKKEKAKCGNAEPTPNNHYYAPAPAPTQTFALPYPHAYSYGYPPASPPPPALQQPPLQFHPSNPPLSNCNCHNG
ncbi:hypothetical protein PTKIN_Ptkin09bG0010300 [Pterospermum kingtungense]